MFRILLWKIGFEWAQIKRILSPDTHRKVYYFAFGANLCQDVLDRRRITVYESFDYAFEGAQLRFSQPGFYKDHGFASADPMDGGVVYGKMYLMSHRDAMRMDYFEGVPFLKSHEKVFSRILSSGQDFFFYRARKCRLGLKPTQQYLDYIVNAYREMPSVPGSYTDELAKTCVLEEKLSANITGKFIADINAWPGVFHPVLIRYEAGCLALVQFLWNRSFFQWAIKRSPSVS